MRLTPFYIYRHIRLDTNEVFYVGKGSYGKYKRHENRYSRNKFWKNIVSKREGKYEIEIIYECETETECNEKEKEFIQLYGRKDMRTGSLCNLTDGGEGCVGVVVSQETRNKLSLLSSKENHPNWGKKLSKQTCDRKSYSLKNSDKNLRGKKLTKEWKDNISKAHRGYNNPMYGKKGADNPTSKIVIHLQTGVFYDSITLAAVAGGYNVKTLSNMLVGHRKNTSNYKIA